MPTFSDFAPVTPDQPKQKEAAEKPVSFDDFITPSITSDIATSIKGSAERVGAFAGQLTVGLTEAFTNVTGLDLDAAKARGYKRTEALRKSAKRDQPKSLAGQLATIPVGFATLPAQIVMAGSDRYQELTKLKVDKGTAAAAALGSAAINAAQIAVPFGKGIALGAASGAASNIAGLAADKQFTQWLLAGNYPAIAAKYKMTKDEVISSGAMGAVMGGLVGKLNGKELKGPEASKALDMFADLSKEDMRSAEVIAETTKPIDKNLAKELDTRITGIKTKEQVPALLKAKEQQDIIPDLSAAQAAANMRNTMRSGYELAGKDEKAQIIKLNSGIPLTKENLKASFGVAKKHLPILGTFERELRQTQEATIRALNPEALGPEAKRGGAILARAIAEQTQATTSAKATGQLRYNFWAKRSDADNIRFFSDYEKGQPLADPMLETMRKGYLAAYAKVERQDAAAGRIYDPRENYMLHTFEDSAGVEKFFNTRYGPKWNTPSFMKERSFELYSEAIKMGFRPRYTNPESVLLARKHMSDIADMRHNALEDMVRLGIGRKAIKGKSPELEETTWRSPNGQQYWIHNDASQILHNAFDTQSLWTEKGPIGTAFRVGMTLKNNLVPIKLAFSGFHLLHVGTIDNFAEMARVTKGKLSGAVGWAEFGKRLARSLTYADTYRNPHEGGELIRLWNTPIEKLNSDQKQVMQFFFDAGFSPEMSREWQMNAIDRFSKARANNSATAIFHAPLAAIELMQNPMMKVWIPRLKAQSELEDIRMAIRVDPSLLQDEGRRIEAFRKITKSVDNRYGEMAYNTLFMHKTIKDAAVLSSLSMGWTLGFLREYGGAIGDIKKVAQEVGTGKSTLKQNITKGDLDRALFVGYYTAGSLLLGGLMTYALGKVAPSDWRDYVYPIVGKNPDGTPKRVSTMFYSREWAGMYLHSREEGIGSGLYHHFAGKVNPVAGVASGLWTNLDYFNAEISDPNGPAMQQLQQKLAWAFKESEPIPITAMRKGQGTEDKILPFLGLNPAPKYATETMAEASIASMYHRGHQSITPYERRDYSSDKRELKAAYLKGDSETYSTKLQEMRSKYHLTRGQVSNIRKGLTKDSNINMFKALTPTQQMVAWNKMTKEEKDKYRKALNKQNRGIAE